ncbi:universal stress protein [Rhodococcus sp. NPDC003318]|uniref:universal stress protein n=1 Tax=Rhodococcus sp. NPDC003318 TaxID=3364503 RepID=UPI00368E97D1
MTFGPTESGPSAGGWDHQPVVEVFAVDETSQDAPVVVGVDGSTSAYAAVAWAAREAQLHRCALRIVSAVGALGPYDEISLPPDYFVKRDEVIRGHLDEASAIARTTYPDAAHAEITTAILEGGERQALIEASKSARMVVVGSRGLGQMTAVLAGSVATALGAHAHSPVVVIRGHAGQTSDTGSVVVGVDGTDNSRPALATAFEEAALRGVGVVAVHTWSQFSQSSVFVDQLGLSSDASGVAEQAVLAESLAGWSECYPQTRVDRVVAQGKPARELQERSADAELLVVGSRGRGGLAGMLLGSTSAELLHTATCPLMIVRSGPAGSPDGS